MTCRPALIRETVRVALMTCSDERGITFPQIIAASGLTDAQVSHSLAALVCAGQLFRAGTSVQTRYFLAADRMAEVWPVLRAEFIALAKERASARARKAYERHKDAPAMVEKRQAISERHEAKKPAKAPKPAKAIPAGVQVKRPAAVKFKDAQAIVPAHVRVQRLPGCPTHSRFEPPTWFKGDFQREWEERRASSQAQA